MKKILIFFLLLHFLNCEAQKILPLYGSEGDVAHAYYKDTFNDLDNFIGTWKYTNGTTTLTVTLQKRIQANITEYNGTNYYADILVGEYKYIENGTELINTLPQLQLTLPNVYSYNIVGNIVIGPNSQYCLGCESGERKVLLSFNDPNRDILGFEPQMIFSRADEGGVQKLELNFRTISGPLENNPQFTSYTIPFGDYLLIKQP